jgi:hypothetical protein
MVDRAAITRWLDAGRRLEEIEHGLLESARLTDEQRAVLWLFAWGESQRRQRARPNLPRPHRVERHGWLHDRP